METNRPMRNITTATVVGGLGVVILVSGAMLTGCGGDSTSGSSGGSTSSATTAKEKPKTYRDRVRACLEDVGYETRNAGNAMRVSTPGSHQIANIQTFRTERQARAFYKQLAVDGAGGGKGVAIFLSGVRSDSDKSVVADCLSP